MTRKHIKSRNAWKKEVKIKKKNDKNRWFQDLEFRMKWKRAQCSLIHIRNVFNVIHREIHHIITFKITKYVALMLPRNVYCTVYCVQFSWFPLLISHSLYANSAPATIFYNIVSFAFILHSTDFEQLVLTVTVLNLPWNSFALSLKTQIANAFAPFPMQNFDFLSHFLFRFRFRSSFEMKRKQCNMYDAIATRMKMRMRNGIRCMFRDFGMNVSHEFSLLTEIFHFKPIIWKALCFFISFLPFFFIIFWAHSFMYAQAHVQHGFFCH